MPYYRGSLWIDEVIDLSLHARLEAQQRQRDNRRELVKRAFSGEFGVAYDARHMEYIMPSGRRVSVFERDVNRYNYQWNSGIIEEIAKWITLKRLPSGLP